MKTEKERYFDEVYDEHVAECPHCWTVSKGARVRPLVVRFTPRGWILRCWECGAEYGLVTMYPHPEKIELWPVRLRESGYSGSDSPTPVPDGGPRRQ